MLSGQTGQSGTGRGEVPKRATEDEDPAGVSTLDGSTHYVQLRDEIVTGVLTPGAPVHEVALSTRMGVSRAPIRDAIRRLEADGLVERGPRGTTVRRRTPDEVYDIYQARIALESEAAATAATRASALDVTRLTLVHDQAVQEQDSRTARQLHAKWHRVLAAAAHNQTIVELLERLVLQLSPYETQSLADSGNLGHTHDEHAAVAAAIQAHDPETARKLVAEHLRRTRDVRVSALLQAEG
jgi:DNA-binding GntR family transcriptional regulator